MSIILFEQEANKEKLKYYIGFQFSKVQFLGSQKFNWVGVPLSRGFQLDLKLMWQKKNG